MTSKISRPINKVVSSPAPKKKLDIDSLLTEEKKAALRKEAEENVLVKEIAAAEAEYLKQQTDLIDRERHPEIVEEQREVRLELPPYMDRIILDGRTYVHGGKYTVGKRVFDVIREITWNAFRHDDEVNNKRNSNAYKQERELRMSAQTGNIIDNTGRPAVKF